MRIGYLHIGRPDHGVYRLGVLLAAEARTRQSLSVIEAAVTLTGKWRQDRANVIAAARALAGTDVVHLQYNSQRDKSVWGSGWWQLYYLRLFARNCRRPFVVNISDFYPRQPPGGLLKAAPRQLLRISTRLVGGRQSSAAPGLSPSAFLKEIKNTFGSVGLTVRWLARHARLMIVCSNEEYQRLSAFVTGSAVRMIFLFVEERTLPVGPAEAKESLRLSGRTVVTLLGRVHPRKGYRLLLQALAQLPSHYVVVLAGHARETHIQNDLMAFSRSCGVEDRVRLTGYLSEEELDRYLAATDLAVCPFETVAASSSISTWISAVRPILASDLPLIAEYNRLESGAIRTFAPYTASALSHAIVEMVNSRGDSLSGVVRLRNRLAISKLFDENVNAYRQALSNGLPPTSTVERAPGSIDNP
jgi:glycosyltransferase involved in cell wall biosynthesis